MVSKEKVAAQRYVHLELVSPTLPFHQFLNTISASQGSRKIWAVNKNGKTELLLAEDTPDPLKQAIAAYMTKYSTDMTRGRRPEETLSHEAVEPRVGSGPVGVPGLVRWKADEGMRLRDDSSQHRAGGDLSKGGPDSLIRVLAGPQFRAHREVVVACFQASQSSDSFSFRRAQPLLDDAFRCFFRREGHLVGQGVDETEASQLFRSFRFRRTHP